MNFAASLAGRLRGQGRVADLVRVLRKHDLLAKGIPVELGLYLGYMCRRVFLRRPLQEVRHESSLAMCCFDW